MADANARVRGRTLERRVAALLGGYVYAGQAGDVVAGDWVVECKYRRGYRLGRLDELASFVGQARSNAQAWGRKGDPKRWAIVLYGGRGTDHLVIVPLAAWKELVDGQPA